MPHRASTSYRPRPFRWLTVGAVAYLGWLISNLVLLVLLPFLIIVDMVGGRAGHRVPGRVGAWFLKFFFLGYFRLIGMYRVGELPDSKRLEALGPCMFVANHRSWIDALLLIALMPDVRVPVNIEYTRVPLAGRMMRWLGVVPLDRNSRKSLSEGAAEVRRLLENGEQVAVFPEGTRSPMGHLRRFSDVFFRIAIDADVPVVPVMIHLSRPFLGPGSENFLTARGAVLRIRMLDPIVPETGERGADLGRRAHKKMSPVLADLDAPEADEELGASR